MSDRRALLRTLPAIDRLLGTALLTKLEETQPHLLIREAAQKTVDDLRQLPDGRDRLHAGKDQQRAGQEGQYAREGQRGV